MEAQEELRGGRKTNKDLELEAKLCLWYGLYTAWAGYSRGSSNPT